MPVKMRRRSGKPQSASPRENARLAVSAAANAGMPPGVPISSEDVMAFAGVGFVLRVWVLLQVSLIEILSGKPDLFLGGVP